MTFPPLVVPRTYMWLPYGRGTAEGVPVEKQHRVVVGPPLLFSHPSRAPWTTTLGAHFRFFAYHSRVANFGQVRHKRPRLLSIDEHASLRVVLYTRLRCYYSRDALRIVMFQ